VYSNKDETRLALYNVAVFAVVLIAFSLILYSVVREGFYSDARSHIKQMTDAIISSIDYDRRDQEKPLPDLIVSQLPSSVSESLMNLRLQWFDEKGKLAIEKGSMNLYLPLNKAGGFETQSNPKSMVFTKAVVVDGELLGYARVGQPLTNIDRAMSHIQVGLSLGVLFASVISGLGILWLISKSMQPLHTSIIRLKQFTADVSHELKTPVTAISTNSSVALKYADGMREGDREKFEMILSASKQMNRLLEDLLQLEGIERAERAPVNVATELSKVLSDVRRITNWLQQEKQIDLVLELQSELYIQCSEEELFQILQNLLENAFRYTPNGGRVTISASRERTMIVIRVSDTGIGISPDDLPKIFDRFWRADKARSRAEVGSGLGLSITKSLVTKLKGSIDAESKVDIGSTFTLRLPTAQN
jgi:signal transduction histidine kinase